MVSTLSSTTTESRQPYEIEGELYEVTENIMRKKVNKSLLLDSNLALAAKV